jgi:hypothetical protein
VCYLMGRCAVAIKPLFLWDRVVIDVSDCGELGILGLPAKNFVVFFQVFFLL